MISLRTLFFSLAMIPLAVMGRAEIGVETDLVRAFANCAGRFSAEMQHQWLMSDPAADRTEAQRAEMIALLEAVLPRDAGRIALRHRSEARQAHAALLTRASFNNDQRDAKWAQRRAEAEMSQCRALIVH